MTLEKRAPLTEDVTVMLTDARDTHEINLALKAAFTDEDEGNILVALHLPKPRSTKPAQKTVGLDGLNVSVSTAATSGCRKIEISQKWGIGRTHQQSLRPPDPYRNRQRRAYGKQLSTPEESPPLTEHCAAGRSKDESHTPTSPNAHSGEQPSNASAESTLSQRKSAVHDQRSLATAPGKPTNYVRTRKRNSKTSKPATSWTAPASCDPTDNPKKATIRVRGGVSVRNGSEEGYDYRVRTLDFANSDSPFSLDETRELAMALANDDHARVVAILERHATMDYPENKGFDQYGDTFGFHFDSIESVHIDWT